jgi:hypothetical protein
MRLPGTAVLAAAAASVLMAGCEISFGKSEEATAQTAGVEHTISAGLAEQSGVPPTSVTCPEEMVQEGGRRYECIAIHPRQGEFVVDVTMKEGQGFEWLTRPQGG